MSGSVKGMKERRKPVRSAREPLWCVFRSTRHSPTALRTDELVTFVCRVRHGVIIGCRSETLAVDCILVQCGRPAVTGTMQACLLQYTIDAVAAL